MYHHLPAPFRVLLVEDDDDHAFLLGDAMRKRAPHVEVSRAGDGETAMREIRDGHHRAVRLPNLIVLDLDLPGITGHEVLTQIKDDPVLCAIPVVVMTTSPMLNDRVSAYQHHANSYLIKPTEFGGFDRIAEALLQYWQQWNQPASQRSVHANPSTVVYD